MNSETNFNPYTGGLRLIIDDFDLRPVQGYTLSQLDDIFYKLQANKNEGRLLFESATLEDMDDFYNPGRPFEDMVLESITVPNYKRMPRRLLALSKVFRRHLNKENIEPQEPIIGRPKKSGLFAYVMVQIPFSDGQVISILFHAPEGDRTKINMASDTLVAFRWLLNKRDITHVVSPEEGREVSLNDLGRRLSQLIARNSARLRTY